MQFKPHPSAYVLMLVLLTSCGTVPKTSLVLPPTVTPLAALDDSLFQRVLTRAVAPNGAVSYNTLRSDTELTEYIQEIARVRTDAFISRSELLAFWLNVHNAYALDMIRMNPARSIDDISGFRYAKVIVTSDGQTHSLDDIEHSILEQQFREPRAFFALFDGSRSSPQLCPEPYSGDRLSSQLDDQFHKFLADSTKNYLDRRANTLYLSKIVQDYSSTLEKMANEALTTLIRDFAPPAMAQWIGGHPAVTISYLGYDNTIYSSDNGFTSPPTHERTPAQPRKTSGGIR